MSLEQLDVLALRRWVITTRAAMSMHADAINALNVFPVPDRDTGTNMSITMELAVDGLAAEAPRDLLSSVEVLARSTLLAARGNSGVILSQLVRGLADVVTALGGSPLRAVDVADVLAEAARRARDGVRAPVEGTMLSVADAAAQAAAHARGESLVDMVDLVVQSAQDAVARTREQLPVLREAGVVDAGAVGYWLVLRALQHVVHREPGTVLSAQVPDWLTPPGRVCPVGEGAQSSGLGHGLAYELMFVLRDGDAARLEHLADVLSQLGDSLVMAGEADLCSVHVHLDDLAAGVNAAVAAGAPERFQITRFAEHLGKPVVVPATSTGSPVVVALASPGLVDLVREADPCASVLLAPDEVALHDALEGAGDCLLLVDTPELYALASAAMADRPGSRLVSSRHPGQLIAALAVLSVLGEGDCADIVALCANCDEAAAEVGTQVVSSDSDDQGRLTQRCREVLDAAITSDIELVTLIAGAQAPESLLEALGEYLHDCHPQVDVTSYPGRRPGVVLDLGCE
ncbi:MAG: DAK2 domain-containing protein [Actinomycetota bacterium]|nr:DAK2 domain-containing protein [Actinomycetota bacterium]